ncbi:MAG TPA: nuclear transport factor 2 family protein [Marmoricola sp.]
MSTDLTALEARLRRLEDIEEITRLVASYGPAVDAGLADDVAGLWTEDGVYDVDEMFMGDQAAIHAMVGSDAHQGLIGNGCTHFLGPVRVDVDGDDAVAVCHSILVAYYKERYVVARSGANRWRLRRTPDGWRAVHRTTRALNGDAEARALLGPAD